MNTELNIEDISLSIVLTRTKGASLRIQVTKNHELLVKAPANMSEKKIEHFIKQKTYWIYRQAKRYEACEQEFAEQEHIRSLPLDKRKQLAYELMKEKTDKYCDIIGVTYDRLRITTATSYWGCCNKTRGTISYVWQMLLLPEDIVDYLVIHELCHMIEPNHSKAFWSNVEKYMPGYKTRRAWLKENGWKYQ
jgi:hypothetical protein